MLYKKSLLYNREPSSVLKEEERSTKRNASQLKDIANDALDATKEKLNETFSDENIEKAKEKAEDFKNIAKIKAAEFFGDAKETFEDIGEKGSELAGETAEHLAGFAEDAKEEIKEASTKMKNFLKNITGTKNTEK